MKQMKFAAIILAAGKGNRMCSDIPKQYMNLCGNPVIYYSLKAFEKSAVDEIVLVAGADDVEFCQEEIVNRYEIKKVRAVVSGGAERYLSVYEGLKAASDADYVLVHDGARPMIDEESIDLSMKMVPLEKACVLATMVKDTIKVVNESGYAVDTPRRNSLWAVQTPQSFDRELLVEAYSRFFNEQSKGGELPIITDDAMLVEQMTNKKVKILPGKYSNIKITTPEDLEIAKMFLKK